MNRADRKRQAKEDEKRLLGGIDPMTGDPASTVAMARQLYALLEKGKRAGSVGEAVKFLHAKVTATLTAMPMAVACARGCSHCCNGWVSATAPEILVMASHVRARGEALVDRVMAAQAAIGAFSMLERPHHPHPCPMLDGHACGMYEARPSACRCASSMDANACVRVITMLLPEVIPSPMRHIRAREFYDAAMVAALTHAHLPHRLYDLTGGLARALAHGDAQGAWLAGEDILAGVPMDPTDVMTKPDAQLVYRQAFG
jgi:hypothetical protein